MVVITVIGLLSAIALPSFADITSSAKVAQVQGNLSNLRTSIGVFHAKTGLYPDLEENEDSLDEVREGGVIFTDYYSKSTAPETPAHEELTASNSIIISGVKSSDRNDWEPGNNIPERPNKPDEPWEPGDRLPGRPNPDPEVPITESGGWIYNFSNGDFFANLPEDVYGEGINWNEY